MINTLQYENALLKIKSGFTVSSGIDTDYLVDKNGKAEFLDSRITTQLRKEGWLKFDEKEGCCVLGDGEPTDYMKINKYVAHSDIELQNQAYADAKRSRD